MAVEPRLISPGQFVQVGAQACAMPRLEKCIQALNHAELETPSNVYTSTRIIVIEL